MASLYLKHMRSHNSISSKVKNESKVRKEDTITEVFESYLSVTLARVMECSKSKSSDLHIGGKHGETL
jgi:hypothetical protein